jgi:hypothetical protein
MLQHCLMCRYTNDVSRTPCKGLRDMQRAIRRCLLLVGAAVPNPPAVPGGQGPTWPYGEHTGCLARCVYVHS